MISSNNDLERPKKIGQYISHDMQKIYVDQVDM